MASLQHPTPIRPLQVEIDGIPKYRQARSVEDLAAFLLSQQGRMSKTIGPRFIMRWRPR